jgi:uncharacterized membrane protein
MRDGDFRLRGKEISRVEGLSDAVFGFAITLLVVSLEVPKTSAEVLQAMRGFFAFAFTFTILFTVWRLQFTFFRRYGLEDNTTVSLTGVLLFVILFFIYPLKFVFGTAVERILLHAGFPGMTDVQPLHGSGITLLFVAFSLGWMAVLGVFALLYRHAYSLRDQLELSPLEILDTEQSVWRCQVMLIPGLITAVMNLVVYFRPGLQDPVAYGGLTLLVLIALVTRRRVRGFKRQRNEVLASLRRAVEA